jgi:glycosyltransferase involved in cell wall biosynthesis
MSIAPSVGVVVPLYNGARYVAEAIDSALAASQGAIKRLVVVDDGSDDNGLDVARGRGTAVEGIRIEHAGVSEARNRGIAMLDTELIAFLDGDDLWPPDSLAVRIEFLARNPQADGVYGRIEQFICPTVPVERRGRLRFGTTARPVPSLTTLLLWRNRFLAAGPLRKEVGNAENLEWLLRARASGLTLLPLDHVVLRRRVHMANTTMRNKNQGLEYIRVLRAHLASKDARPE